MAQAYKTLFFNLILVLSLVLLISLAESRNLDIGFRKKDSSIVCNSIYGQQSGDTCSSVAQEFNLSLDEFLSFNPNINCDAIFVGEWLCVAASLSN